METFFLSTIIKISKPNPFIFKQLTVGKPNTHRVERVRDESYQNALMLESRVKKKEKAQTFALIIYLLPHARHTHTCPARAQTCSLPAIWSHSDHAVKCVNTEKLTKLTMIQRSRSPVRIHRSSCGRNRCVEHRGHDRYMTVVQRLQSNKHTLNYSCTRGQHTHPRLDSGL